MSTYNCNSFQKNEEEFGPHHSCLLRHSLIHVPCPFFYYRSLEACAKSVTLSRQFQSQKSDETTIMLISPTRFPWSSKEGRKERRTEGRKQDGSSRWMEGGSYVRCGRRSSGGQKNLLSPSEEVHSLKEETTARPETWRRESTRRVTRRR